MDKFVQIPPTHHGPIDKVNNHVTPLLNQRLRWINESGQSSEENREMFYQWIMELWFHLHRELWVSLRNNSQKDVAKGLVRAIGQ